MDDTAITNIKNREHLDFESAGTVKQGDHPSKVIVKSNERGAYGLGVLRQGVTNMHVTTRYARKSEVAKALKLKEIEVTDSRKPPGGWPR